MARVGVGVGAGVGMGVGTLAEAAELGFWSQGGSLDRRPRADPWGSRAIACPGAPGGPRRLATTSPATPRRPLNRWHARARGHHRTPTHTTDHAAASVRTPTAAVSRGRRAG